MTDDRMHSPIPAPSEAQLDAGADRDPNSRVAAPEGVQPELTPDQINTSIDGNAPHTQPTGEFSGSEYPVDPSNPNDIEPADQRLGNVAGVDDLDENGQPREGKAPSSNSQLDTANAATPAAVAEQREGVAGGANVKGAKASAK